MSKIFYKLILLDRDGVINQKAPEHDYIRSPEMLRLTEGADKAIARLHKAGLKIAVVTNQRGVSRDLMSLEDVSKVNTAIQKLVSKAGGKIDAFYVCPHGYDDNCNCRKPAPGLLLKAMDRFHVKKERCIMIGDSNSDVEAAANAGVDCIYLGEKELAYDYEYVIKALNLSEAVDIILQQATLP